MSREERIRRFAAAVQEDIVSCPNEQSFEGGEVVCWISGCPTSVGDLLMNHEVPEELQEDVVGRLRCPSCGNDLEAWQDVGTKYSFEQDHDYIVEGALAKHGKQLFDFYGFLHKHPMLGATHPFGRRILTELKKAPRVSLHKPNWFRARVDLSHGFGPAPHDKVNDQRYNSSGQSRWYFADNAETAVAEVAKDGKAWTQAFDLGTMRGLLDLRSWRADDERVLDEEGNYHPPHDLLLVSIVYGDLLMQRHYSDDAERAWKPEYLVPRFIAEAAGAAGFNGIICQSVRFPGENLVIFDATWCPKAVGEPILVSLDENSLRTREGYIWNHGEGFSVADIPVIGAA